MKSGASDCVNTAFMGVGATQRLSAVRWGVAAGIVWAWIRTIPAAVAVAVLSYKLLLIVS